MSEQTDLNNFNKDIRYLKGVGPKRAEAFSSLGINKVSDMIEFFPRSYEDRSIVKKINEVIPGEKVTVKCFVSNIELNRIRRNLSILKVILFDGTGYISAVWFNQDYYYNKLNEGNEYWFFGKIDRKILLEMQNPVFSDTFIDFAIIVPVYNKNKGLTQNIIRKSVKIALNESKGYLNDFLPKSIIENNNLISYSNAINNIHYPKSNELFYKARNRLVFQEFFMLQTALLLLKSKLRNGTIKGRIFTSFNSGNQYIENLKFELTKAQKKVIEEIRIDFSSGTLMHRLIQGDVGSGKTAVAATVISDVCSNRLQAAFMAPTEILAKQHYDNLQDEFLALGFKTVFLSGNIKGKKRERILELIKTGETDIIIGTHALIQSAVDFNNLGLVITDEQHRFGVDQRTALSMKGENPHVLVMTATPIPRTLALILYGDLDISIIDEMPPGRKSIETYAVTEGKRRRVLEFARKRMKEGQQVYVVCPRIEDSDEDDEMISVESFHKELSLMFSEYNVGLIHGKKKPGEKEQIMADFHKGTINMLVSTTVIEVGVHVSNATVMIIENAERFGLAQLHQLRGRVGRGSEQSFCIMINRSNSPIASRRMKIMEDSTDGFKISEQDLVIRGPGEFF